MGSGFWQQNSRTCRGDDVTAEVAEAAELKASGQRHVGDHLNGVVVGPLVNQVVHGPAV